MHSSRQRQLKTALAAGAMMLGTAAANAAVILFNDFSTLSGLQVNGAARSIHGCAATGVGSTCSSLTGVGDAGHPNPKVLRLTNDFSQSGNAFSTSTISLASDASFSTAFLFQITDSHVSDGDGPGADGIVFVVQTVSNNVGGGGGGIGYDGIQRSVGIEFDTWNNGGIDGNNGNHVGIDINGSVNSVARANVGIPSPGRMNNGAVWYAWVDYDGANDLLEVRLNTTAARPAAAFLSLTVDLVNVLQTTDAFVGFTSGTGAADGDHDILSWQFNSTFDPIDQIGAPEPGMLALFGLGLALVGFMRRAGER